MRAVVASRFGEPKDVLSLSDSVKKPAVAPGSGHLLVRVQACSISPGDWRMMSGDVSALRTPPSWPYVPGQDVAGVVEAVDPKLTGDDARFKVGDAVVATWQGMMAMGGMATHCLVDASMTAHRPPSVDPVTAAAASNSLCHAIIGVDLADIKPADRVLVLGGSGGAGTAVVQLVKRAGVAFLASTSSDTALLSRLGVDRPVDYTKENWWEVPEFVADPFDVVIDCAEGAVAWTRSKSGLCKTAWQGGRHVSFLLDEHRIVATSYAFLATFTAQLIARTAYSRLAGAVVPRFSMKLDSPTGAVLARALELVASKEVDIVLAAGSPHPFTAEGVADAFDVLRSRHAKGKVVVKIAD